MEVFARVAARVWVTTSPTWSTTSTVVVADDGAALLCDPALTPPELAALAAGITAHGWRVTAAVSTHPHWDHVLWTAELPDVPRWATPEAAAWTAANLELLEAQAQADLPGHRWETIGGTTPLPGPEASDGTLEVPWRGPRVTVIPTPGHALGHASVYLPDDGVLLAGDMLSDIEVPLLDTGMPDPVTDYRSSLEVLRTVVEQCEVVIPGHGSPAGRTQAQQRIDADLAYLADLRGTTDLRLASRRVRAEHTLQVQELGPRARTTP